MPDDPRLKTLDAADYDRLRERWKWVIPETLNIAERICDHWADSPVERTALEWVHADDTATSYTFEAVRRRTNRVGNALRASGVDRGSFVGIYLPSLPEHVFATFGAHKVGAVAMPLYALFGPDALRPRLEAATPEVLVTDRDGLETLAAVPTSAHPETVVVLRRYDDRSVRSAAGEIDAEVVRYGAWLSGAAEALSPVATDPEEPAQLFFTSGTTGDPKGVLQPHRVVVGHQYVGPFVREYHPEDLVCHVGDLSWAGGFNNVLETWAIGAPLLKFGGRFDPERLLDILARYDADILMIPPTAVRSLMDVPAVTVDDYGIDLRVVASGGERVTPDILEWAEETFGAFATNVWGQTECYAIGWPATGDDHAEKLGSAGRPLPGFEVTVLDDDGAELPPGELGQLAVRRPGNPTMFLEYHDMPEETEGVRSGDWHLTGDSATVDEDGYVWVRGRMDDVIISSGYRLSPVEIESTLATHPAVAEAAVVGVEDERKTNRIVAFLELRTDAPGDDLRAALEDHVRERLSPVQYPDEIRFLEALPTTTTGKLRRTELRERYRDDDGTGE